jgi:N,N'-diacetyllegionaminate synthase
MELSKVTIIAEAGVNHNGDISLAKKLVDAAAAAGADYVKFQTFKADKLVSKEAKMAGYQKENIKSQNDSQFDMLKALELSEADHYVLKEYAENRNIKFLSTGFDEDSIDFLNDLGVDLFKVPSGEITNLPYLQHIVRKNKPVILSTGMATMEEISKSLAAIEKAGLKREMITVLHCTTNYPTEMNEVNLKAMKAIENSFQIKVGYSDHTLGIEVPIAAVALGATVIEKHFTIDRNLPGPDHRASLEPAELKEMVRSIRNIEIAVSGSGRKEPTSVEIANIQIVRKSIHLRRDLPKGAKVQMDDLIMMRPATGISPMEIDKILGKVASRDLKGGTVLQFSDLG